MKDLNFINNKRILITGGAGFIGSALIRKLLNCSNCKIFNIDKLNYASDLKSINNILDKSIDKNNRYKFFKCDLSYKSDLNLVIKEIKPEFIIHLAAESHVDKSINHPYSFIESNIIGTFNLLNSSLMYWGKLPTTKKKLFRFLHISTDEVFGSTNTSLKFNEDSPYSPNSPYSASKASSDHLVRAWFKTYKLPTLITNCSNNYGPWQFPEKLIPLIIHKALLNKEIPIYGNGENIRDWVHVQDHIDAVLKVLNKGKLGESYCIGGDGERKNIEIAMFICSYLDNVYPAKKSYKELIRFVKDRPGHDLRYAIDSTKIRTELNWQPNIPLEDGLKKTIDWYIKNIDWLNKRIILS